MILTRVPLQALASLFTSLVTCVHFGEKAIHSLTTTPSRSTASTSTKNVYVIYLVFVTACFVVFFDILLLLLAVNKKTFTKSPTSVNKRKYAKKFQVVKWIIFISSLAEFALLLADYVISTPQSLIQYGQMIEATTNKKASSFNGYGNWCGLGAKRDDALPLDQLDNCCYEHNECYANISYCDSSSSTLYLAKYEFDYDKKSEQVICLDASNRLCACDKQSAECLQLYSSHYNESFKSSYYLDWLIDLIISNQIYIIISVSSLAVFLASMKLLFMFECARRVYARLLYAVCCGYTMKRPPMFLSKLTILFNSISDLIELVQRFELKVLVCSLNTFELVSNFVLVLLSILLYLIDMILFLTSSPPDQDDNEDVSVDDDEREKDEEEKEVKIKSSKRPKSSTVYPIPLKSYRKSSYEQETSRTKLSTSHSKTKTKWACGRIVNTFLKILMLILSICLFVNFILIQYII